MRRRLLVALIVLAPIAARAQPVEVATLAPPDAFTTPGRATGLGADLWREASPDTLKAVMPRLTEKGLSKAAAALARRVLATGAPAPKGLGSDPDLLAARAEALTALGDLKASAAVAARAPGMDRSARLSRLAAEDALLAGDDARACAVADALTVGRDDIYWLRLRAFCQAIGGHADQAQLTFDLAQSQAKDAVFGRLMGAKLAAAGSPGAPALRNGLDYALSKSLGLDLAKAKPAPAVAAALAAADPAEPAWSVPDGPGDGLAAARLIAARQPVPADLVGRLLDAADPAALIVAAYAGAEGPELRGKLAALGVAEGKAPVGRNLAMDDAGREHLMGETAILALATCAEAGPAGLSAGERARIVRALRMAGLTADAANFALEGLLGP